jgi:steroid 5-alpha reductase family enzyme
MTELIVLGISTELKIMFQIFNLQPTVLLVLANRGSSIQNAVNDTSFDTWRVIGIEIKISAGVSRFPVNFRG